MEPVAPKMEPTAPRMEPASDGVEPGHTNSTEGSVEGAHAVEFSKTVAPLLGRWFLPGGRAEGHPASERIDEYSAESRPGGCPRGDVPARRPAPKSVFSRRADASATVAGGSGPYEITCTVTVRLRGRSSKSISTICCQVPSARRPPTSGIVSDGPITAARRCAWAF